VRFGEVRLEPNGLAGRVDRAVEVALVEERGAEVEVRHCEVRLEPDGLAVVRDGPIQGLLCPVFLAQPRKIRLAL
jgi:hypothetical protein